MQSTLTLKLVILLPQPPECYYYKLCTPRQPANNLIPSKSRTRPSTLVATDERWLRASSHCWLTSLVFHPSVRHQNAWAEYNCAHWLCLHSDFLCPVSWFCLFYQVPFHLLCLVSWAAFKEKMFNFYTGTWGTAFWFYPKSHNILNILNLDYRRPFLSAISLKLPVSS